ncbi:DUF6233 domain-containing protein [Streptomyces sp. NPDC056149]|uniref:DUF6233 domain-containing protein n=1 Tax=Streptomyces sp. NPDC056149 TaxID=3345728 RepID=UPI0035DC00C7
MHDLPPDVGRLRVLETWLALSLERVRRQIAVAEQQDAQQKRAAPPPVPKWVVQLSIGGSGQPVAVHVGDCTLAGRRARPISHEQAVRALTEGLEACSLCRPDTELGML